MSTTVQDLARPSTVVSGRAGQHLTATLILGCLAQFMVILDVSVVNVALPAIRHSLGFSEDGLQWVVNAYTVTFAGFLLLGGRAADLLGRRRVFVWGLVLFALASLAGGMTDSRTLLIVARLVQGLGGAVIAPASLSILTTTFTEPKERNRAVGIWGAMGGAGGSAGVLLGGVLTQISWRWVLFINVPIGLIAALAAARLISESRNPNATRNFDLAGALSATIGLTLLVLGIVRTDTSGWGNLETLILIGAGVALLAAFLLNEGRIAKAPLVPLRLFRSRALSAANVIIFLTGGSTFGMWFFFSLYLQDVRHYSPLHTGLIFLPITLAIMIGSFLVSKITLRVGPKRLLVIGMLMLSGGLLLFSKIGVSSTYVGQMLAPGLLTGFGIPLAFIPSAITATSGVKPSEAGLASGVVNTSRMFGGALGLAVLATLATSHSNGLLHHPTAAVHTANQALVAGFQLAFEVGAAMALIGVVVAVFGTPSAPTRVAAGPAEAAIEL